MKNIRITLTGPEAMELGKCKDALGTGTAAKTYREAVARYPALKEERDNLRRENDRLRENQWQLAQALKGIMEVEPPRQRSFRY